MNTDINVLKLRTFCSKIYIDNINKEYDEINQIDMSDDKESDERDQISRKWWRKRDWRYIILETEKIEFAEKYRQ